MSAMKRIQYLKGFQAKQAERQHEKYTKMKCGDEYRYKNNDEIIIFVHITPSKRTKTDASPSTSIDHCDALWHFDVLTLYSIIVVKTRHTFITYDVEDGMGERDENNAIFEGFPMQNQHEKYTK